MLLLRPDYFKIVIGTQDQRRDGMKAAFLKILDSDIPVSLIK